MNFIRRIGLWIATNMAIVALITIITQLFGIEQYFADMGQYYGLLGFALVFGFLGSFISLLMSKTIAKRAYRVQIIKNPQNNDEKLIWSVVEKISLQLGLKMPEVGIYPSNEVNAFATGSNKNAALVAVSQGLMQNMSQDEIEGVLGHEMAHVANGDMITMTLLQGVINTFVIFFSRIIAQIVMSKNENSGQGSYLGFTLLFEFLFGFFANLIVFKFSRWREFRADAGSAKFVGKKKMINALMALQKMQTRVNPTTKGFQTMRINSGKSMLGGLLRTHPPIADRINALQLSTEV